MESLLGLLGPYGVPISFIGFVLFMYAYFRKQDAQVLATKQETIDRQNEEIEEYVRSSKEKDAQIKELQEIRAELIIKNAVLEGQIQAFKLKGSE